MAMMGTGTAKGDSRAREAAEAAIRSPLLDDISLQGARGILVNITAGMDLSLGEFSDVDDTVEEYASNDATVVVGTVIDPDMSGDLRVTVVATGLGAEQEVQIDTSVSDFERGEKSVGNNSVQPDYASLDRPTVMRNPQSVRSVAKPAAVASKPAVHREPKAPLDDRDMDYLDIPAFCVAKLTKAGAQIAR